jgi:hypothetical protein
MKTTFRRLQQLEKRHSESLAANDASGALERILEKIGSMAEPLRQDPNGEAIPKPTVAEVRLRLQETQSRYRRETVT